MTFLTFDQSDEVTWPDEKKNLPTYLPTYLPIYLPTHLPTNLREHPQGAILDTCHIWDIWSAVMIWPDQKDRDKVQKYEAHKVVLARLSA